MTLVEVMVAATLMLSVVAGFGTALLTCVRTNRFASAYYAATCIGRNRIQRARVQSFNSLVLLNETMRPIDRLGNYDVFGRYRRTTIISNVSVSCSMIVVQVYYPVAREGLTDVPIELQTKISLETQEELFE